MMGRRGFAADAMKLLAPRYEDALLTLERLAQGLMVFDLDANIAAGVPRRVGIGIQNSNPSSDNRMFGIWPDTAFGPGGCGWFGRW
jgi:hypothetical protein